MVQLSYPYMTTGKTIALTICTFVGKVKSLLFNTLSKECSNYCTAALVSHTSKVLLKILQARLQQYMEWELPDVQAGFRKGREIRYQITNILGIIGKARGFQRKRSTSASLSTLNPLTMWITTKLKFLKEMGIPDHLTCLLINLCVNQEATVRTFHGTTDWFKIGKGLRQGYVLSLCFFNL